MSKWVLGLVEISLAAAILSGCTPPANGTAASPTKVPAGDTTRTVAADSMQRTYLLHVPPGFSADRPAALVFVFHGVGEDGFYISTVTGMSEVADASGFLAVYPAGTAPPGPLSWNAGGCCGYAFYNRVDEPAFIREILADLARTVAIDPKRIYATGFSNGALLSYRLACEMSETFAAIAPVAGILSWSPCQPKEPVSVLHIHGSGDVSVPYSGGGINPITGLPFPSINRGIAAWVRLDGCPDTPQTEWAGIVEHTSYTSCRNGTSVELYVLRGWSHLWPVSSVLPASQVIWDFFAAHPKP